MRRRQHVLEMAERMLRRQWFEIEYVHGGTRYLPSLQRLDERRFVDDGTACRIDQICRRLHQVELISAHQASTPVAENEMNGQNIRLAEYLLFGNQAGARGSGLLFRQVLTPGDHVHAESPS